MILLKNLFKRKRTRSPKVVIRYGRLIDPVYIFYCQNNSELKKSGWNDWTPPTRDELDKRIKAYRDEWGKYDIVENISKVLKLPFKSNIIDIYIVSGTPRATSHPIIIKSGFKPKEFVTVLAHELIHYILTENNVKRVIYDQNESESTNNHVIVYAVLKKILNKELWDMEVNSIKSLDYKKALEVSQKIGGDEVIKKMIGR